MNPLTKFLGMAAFCASLLAAPVAAQAKAQESMEVHESINLAKVSALIQLMGLEVEQIAGEAGETLNLVFVTLDDGQRVPILAIFFFNCTEAAAGAQPDCSILRFGSADYNSNFKRSAEFREKATHEKISAWNIMKTSSPLLVQDGEGGLFLRSDLEMRGGVSLARVIFHLGEALEHINASQEFLLGETSSGLTAGLPKSASGLAALKTPLQIKATDAAAIAALMTGADAKSFGAVK